MILILEFSSTARFAYIIFPTRIEVGTQYTPFSCRTFGNRSFSLAEKSENRGSGGFVTKAVWFN